METIGKITVSFIGIISAFLVALLGAKIILSVSELYGIAFITSFSFVQIYGAMSIKSIVFYRYRKQDELKEGESAIKKMFATIFNTAFFYLLAWGLSFFAFYILN